MKACTAAVAFEGYIESRAASEYICIAIYSDCRDFCPRRTGQKGTARDRGRFVYTYTRRESDRGQWADTHERSVLIFIYAPIRVPHTGLLPFKGHCTLV